MGKAHMTHYCKIVKIYSKVKVEGQGHQHCQRNPVSECVQNGIFCIRSNILTLNFGQGQPVAYHFEGI